MGANRDLSSPNDLECLTVVVREEGTTAVIELHGEWDLAGLPSIRQAIARVMYGMPDCIVLDLSRLGFIDSSGMHAAIELTKRASAQNTRLLIVPGPEAVQRMFEIAGLLERLPFIEKRPNGRRVARPRRGHSGAAGTGAFSPPTDGAGRLLQTAGAAPGGLWSPPRSQSHHAPFSKRRRRPATGRRT